MNDEQTIRLECLRLVTGGHSVSQNVAHSIVQSARQLSDFVLGRRDAELVRAAEDLAEKVRGV